MNDFKSIISIQLGQRRSFQISFSARRPWNQFRVVTRHGLAVYISKFLFNYTLAPF